MRVSIRRPGEILELSSLHNNLHLAARAAIQIVMKTGAQITPDFGRMGLRRRQTTKHGEVSSRPLIFDPKPYNNQCKDCLPSTNEWFFETVR
jgi:hypothetical protein